MDKRYATFSKVNVIFFGLNIFLFLLFPLLVNQTYPNNFFMLALVVAVYPFSLAFYHLILAKIVARIDDGKQRKVMGVLALFMSSFSVLILLFNKDLGVLIFRQILAGLGAGMFTTSISNELARWRQTSAKLAETLEATVPELLAFAAITLVMGLILQLTSFNLVLVLSGVMLLMLFVPLIVIPSEKVPGTETKPEVKDMKVEPKPVAGPIIDTNLQEAVQVQAPIAEQSHQPEKPTL